jgi:hypothetical protein
VRPRLYLAAGWLAGGVGAVTLWESWHQPGGYPALAAAGAAYALAWPLAAVAVVYGLRGTGPGLLPYRVRMWWRRRRDRPHIPNWLRRAVYAADRYACIWCGAVADLQVDHIRPWACGGLSCLWNTATLCGPHNRIKSCYWVYRSGLVVYRSFPGSDDEATAAAILAAERRARRSPLRWLRAAWALR